MIQCEHYQKYEGPKLVKAILGEEDITDKMTDIYGASRNWNGCLWTFKESFGSDSYGKNFRLDFVGEDGREHWFHGFISDIDQYFNPPLATPMTQR
jgi:hypothetical protein|tara:strand:- start:202 stop:489 length:288 start_codon:yes stop_codon:yes gene_type:complete